jgi:DNA adenine methylase
MQYLGGKSRVAPHLARVMLAQANSPCYVEPFAGACSVAVRMASGFKHVYLSDASPDLIALWKAMQSGWVPPETISEDLYGELRHAPVSAVRGFAGYGCSFGGKWFGGYARDPKHGRNFARTAGSLLKNRVARLRNASFSCSDYRDVSIPVGSVVYCDPPYLGATRYTRLANFDSGEFWCWAAIQSRKASVYVSEYRAPVGWQPIWSSTPRVTLRRDSNSPRPTEHLWVYNGKDYT